MLDNLGIVQQGATVYIAFNTVTADDPPVPVSPSSSWVDGDFFFVKNGTVTAIDAAATTPSTDINSTTGAHQLAVALSGDADFTGGSSWVVWLAPATTTVDGADVAVPIARFSIELNAAVSQRALMDTLYGVGHILGASGSHSTTAIDLTGVVDADTADDALNGLTALVVDSDGNQNHVRITDFVNSTLIATVNKIDDGGAMDFTPASGDFWFITGFDATTRNGSPLAVAGAQMNLVDAPNATAVTAIQSGLSTFDASTDTVDVGAINGATLTGDGTSGTEWGPA